MKKAITAVLIATLAFALCSCDGDTGVSGTPVPQPSAAAKTSYMKAGDNYRIFLYYINEEQDIDQIYGVNSLRERMTAELGRSLQDEYGIKITFVPWSGSWFTEYCSSAAAGDPMAEMMYAGGPHTMLSNYMWNGIPGSALQPFSAYSYVEDFSDPEYWDTEAQQKMCTYNGELYYIVVRLIGESMVNLNQFTFYNKALLSDAGYSQETLAAAVRSGEWTWDYLEQVALAVNDPDRDVYALITAQENSLAYNLMCSNGGDYIKKKEVNGQLIDRFTAHDTESVKAWDFFVKLSSSNLVRPDSMGDEIALFKTGKTAMMMTYLNRADTFAAEMEQDFGLLPIPKAPGANEYVSTLNWFMPYAMFRNIQNPEGVVEFAGKFFKSLYAKNSTESTELMEAELSIRLRDTDSVEFAMDAVNYTYVSNMMMYQNSTAQYMWGATNSFVSGETTPAVYFSSVADAVNGEIDKYIITSG